MNLPRARSRRGVNLTPMVDVVFLLLFFFMLASRFGPETSLPIALAGGDSEWSGPPRLVEVGSEGVMWLNGVSLAPGALPAELDRLMDDPSEPVVVAPRTGARVGDLTSALGALRTAGFSNLAVAR